MCKMAVLGRGSMKDRHKEEELRASGDPKFQHLSEELHVEISAFATPAEAHARIAYALAEVRRFLVPRENDCKQPLIVFILYPTTETEIKHDIKHDLEAKNAPGYDGISSEILKTIVEIISLPFSVIFNNVLESGHFPTALKNFIVTPSTGKSDEIQSN
ncbi:hypothetical protein JTB14_022863 [Gonioctena quinquepunctata]|nr:hypothetical protein JTB14_022863 [Gonioctena quinquepunctata]